MEHERNAQRNDEEEDKYSRVELVQALEAGSMSLKVMGMSNTVPDESRALFDKQSKILKAESMHQQQLAKIYHK